MSPIRKILQERDAERERAAAMIAEETLARLRAEGFAAWLVGSLARGEFRAHSDIDILLDVEGVARDEALRLCVAALRGHKSSIVFKGDLRPDQLRHFEAEAADGPRLRGY